MQDQNVKKSTIVNLSVIQNKNEGIINIILSFVFSERVAHIANLCTV